MMSGLHYLHLYIGKDNVKPFIHQKYFQLIHERLYSMMSGLHYLHLYIVN
jgi:hypothetical protein